MVDLRNLLRNPSCVVRLLQKRFIACTNTIMLSCWRKFRHNLFWNIMTSTNGGIFSHYRPFVRGIHRWPVNFPHRGQWRGTLLFSLICAWTNDWVNTRDAGDLRRHRSHYDVTVNNLTALWVLIYFSVSLPKARWCRRYRFWLQSMFVKKYLEFYWISVGYLSVSAPWWQIIIGLDNDFATNQRHVIV